MNKAKKEVLRKCREARQGKTERELKEIDEAEAKLKAFNDLVSDIHYELFPEEYDFYFDSITDSKQRSRGINPLSAAYIDEVNLRRKELGVPPLTSSGQASGPESSEFSRVEAVRRISVAP